MEIYLKSIPLKNRNHWIDFGNCTSLDARTEKVTAEKRIGEFRPKAVTWQSIWIRT